MPLAAPPAPPMAEPPPSRPKHPAHRRRERRHPPWLQWLWSYQVRILSKAGSPTKSRPTSVYAILPARIGLGHHVIERRPSPSLRRSTRSPLAAARQRRLRDAPPAADPPGPWPPVRLYGVSGHPRK